VTAGSGSRSIRRTTIAALVAAFAGGFAAAPATAVPASAGVQREVTAVVALVRPHPIGGPGVAVSAYLPSIGAEIVRATPAALRALAATPGVGGVQVDAPVRTADAGADTAGQGVYSWAGLGGNAGRAGAGRDVTVAVVDTGVSDTEALSRASGRLVDGVDASPLADGGEPLTQGRFPDGFGHGTFLAGLIAGGWLPGAQRPLGVAPAARIVNVKVATDDGRTSLAAVLAGLDWVASHRPIDVVSLALAAERPGDAYGADPLTVAVARLRGRGITVLAAAGNVAGRVGDPGFAPRALTVGAADTTGSSAGVAPFSGSAVVAGMRKPDVVAPGVRVLGLLPEDSVLARAFPGARQADGLWRGSGTSEATAVATGAAAVYLGEHPTANAIEVKQALRGAAAPLADERAGAGLLRSAGDEMGDTGEDAFDAQEFWSQAWAENGWFSELRAAWSQDSWPVWGPWSADRWSAKSWSAKSWSAKSWSAKSWSAKSWSAKSWGGDSWTFTSGVDEWASVPAGP
jgi:serine protease AprX